MFDFYYEIDELLNAPEGEHFEFKEAKSRFGFGEALKYCCAIANCGGGKLVLGITDKRPRKVVGSMAFDQPERTCKGLMEKLHIRVTQNPAKIFTYRNYDRSKASKIVL